ncbi:hypothetical protein CUMW_255790 [Citrus unshiu]|uniref:Uncharacterized protein n=1 Tax=Citrus unshiu TaxID=55188 RepID=A0A2H5QSU9_CITUN|nr:hypothetical protein CUMW_255790 [Citrus unshiu]
MLLFIFNGLTRIQVGGGGGFWSAVSPPPNAIVAVTALAGVALLAAVFYTNARTGRLKSPWSRRKRKQPLSPQQWRSLFTSDGKFRDGGVKFLKKVRSRVSRHFRQPIVLISQVLGLLPLGYLNKPSIYIVM